MFKIALKVAYLGRGYHGFARQPNLPTVEGELIKALREAKIFDEPAEAGYSIAGRTDRGVNSLGNVISFRTESKVNINQLNDILPLNIKVLAQASVHHGFQPRFARERHYRYLWPNTPFEDDLSLDAIKEGAKEFVGTFDFRNFSKRSERNPLRTIKSLEVVERENVIMFDVKGESFLWNMVRKIVAVLLNVGKGDLDISDVKEFLNPQKRVFITPMPSEGLILMDITYDKVKFISDSYAEKIFLSVLMDNYLDNRTPAASYEEMMRILDYQKNKGLSVLSGFKVLR
ncbi:MAG TPA: tRNA pseudouridine(38-40) synthase TruA [Methanobacteriaceae archaeon]|nr:tRNA pseudouridine(38-40) synthase TruA [Methanobacteriaceae archaeon]